MNPLKNKVLSCAASNPDWTYKQIAEFVGCVPSTCCYFLGKGVKERKNIKQREDRRIFIESLKMKHGGKCKTCGYSRCLRALHFHHRNPNDKVFDISFEARNSKKNPEIIIEADKCDLLCSNCHIEVHDEMDREKRGSELN